MNKLSSDIKPDTSDKPIAEEKIFKCKKIIQAILKCTICNDKSTLGANKYGEFPIYCSCVSCNQLFRVSSSLYDINIEFNPIFGEDALNIFALEEKYKNHSTPFLIIKTK